jgi:hypothetical protein
MPSGRLWEDYNSGQKNPTARQENHCRQTAHLARVAHARARMSSGSTAVAEFKIRDDQRRRLIVREQE